MDNSNKNSNYRQQDFIWNIGGWHKLKSMMLKKRLLLRNIKLSCSDSFLNSYQPYPALHSFLMTRDPFQQRMPPIQKLQSEIT